MTKRKVSENKKATSQVIINTDDLDEIKLTADPSTDLISTNKYVLSGSAREESIMVRVKGKKYIFNKTQTTEVPTDITDLVIEKAKASFFNKRQGTWESKEALVLRY